VALSKNERRKDTVQVVVESGLTHAGQIAGIVTRAAREVTRELGDWATDVFEMREASRRAAEEAGEPAEPADPGAGPPPTPPAAGA
jgi:hypothetical protein